MYNPRDLEVEKVLELAGWLIDPEWISGLLIDVYEYYGIEMFFGDY